MIKPIGLEEIVAVAPVPGPVAARTVSGLTDPLKRRLVWFLQWRSHQDGGLKRFAHELLSAGPAKLGSPTMLRAGFDASTYFSGATFESICTELSFYPLEDIENLKARLESGGHSFLDLLEPTTAAEHEAEMQRQTAWEKERRSLEEAIKPQNRRASAATFLYECRRKAVRELPLHLAYLCRDAAAPWSLVYIQGLQQGLEHALNQQAKLADQIAAPTKIIGFIEDALNFAHRNRALVVCKGTERLGKTKGAKKWVFANPDKARLVSLTAGTTDALFYEEIYEALGCGEKKTAGSSELRSAIRETLQNRDIALIFDEAHCLFGLSHKASIKRLEYIRTEFVNRDIPVVLIITPQFATRLRELERQTEFNVNQFRGRIQRWAELPAKPARADIECLCRFCLPGVADELIDLLTNFALESEYPFAAVQHAITEVRDLASNGKVDEIDVEAVKRAIGVALFTSGQVATTLPTGAPASGSQKRQRGTAGQSPVVPVVHMQEPSRGDASALQAPSTGVAPRRQQVVPAAQDADFLTIVTPTRAQQAVSV